MSRVTAGEANVGRPKLSPRKKLKPSAISLSPVQWEELDAILDSFNARHPDEALTRNELIRQFLAWAAAEYRADDEPDAPRRKSSRPLRK